ncbi:calcium-binding protein [Desertihabitans brevis]|uniref:Calcium-binding protein n=1 Tax=Desertihabitans brevis TaxID=2268447 RepID=A0A367YXD8_9ACTN|nr:calcium-binding protein [Desertihabitans brevis]
MAVLASAALLALPTAGTVEAASSPKPKSYANCTALNKVYPHGVGKAKAKDKVSGKSKPVTNFRKSDKVYSYNDGGSKRYKGEKDLDRDNDGIACEKR